MAQVTKDMLIGQLLQLDPNMACLLYTSRCGRSQKIPSDRTDRQENHQVFFQF